MNIIALDPAFRNIGWSAYTLSKDNVIVLLDTGVIITEDSRPKTVPRIKTKIVTQAVTGKLITRKVKAKRRGNASDDHRHAIVKITTEILELIERFNIECVMAEIPNGSQNAKSALLLGMTAGLVISTCVAIKMPLIPLTLLDVKHIATDLLESKLGITMEKGDEPTKADIMKLAEHMYPMSANHCTNILRSGERRIIASTFEHIADSVMVLHAGIADEGFKIMRSEKEGTKDIKMYQKSVTK